ncbi:hypothetical protein ACOCJ7_09785 [Knoellia sp. CPCC 206453]|uniref:hypothetical protein n=1 Tax=Knoellia pratensis TaxID=3404796 RepID=UPI00361AB889
MVLLALSGCSEPEDQERLIVDVISDVCLAGECHGFPVSGVELTLTVAERTVGSSVTDDAGKASFVLPKGSGQGEVRIARTPWPRYPAETISAPVTYTHGGYLSISLRLPMLKATPAT